MELTITARHLEVTDAVRAYATDKAGKLPRYFDRIGQVEVVLGRRDNHTYDVELIAHIAGHDHLVAHGRHADVYAAIDDAEAKMHRQLADHKTRLVDRHHGH